MSQRAARPPRAAPGLSARAAGAALLVGVLEQGRPLSQQIEANGPLTDLSPADRARAQTLATGVLTRLAALDAVLAPYLKQPPAGLGQAALRQMAYELLVEDVPPHAAVDGAVRVVRSAQQTTRLAGLVNAVGRRLAEARPEFPTTPQPLPGWLQRRLKRAWGSEAVAAIAAAHQAGAPLDLTLKGAPVPGLDGDLLPTGTVRLPKGAQVSALPGYAEGAWWVQDAAAALPVRLLGDIAGAEVIDLCAAPGGKTLQLAALGARVTSVDRSAPRLERLTENLDRTGLCAQVVTADALGWQPETPPDVVVLDAPCSATGTIRRHPDLPFVRKPADLDPLVALQAQLLDRAASWLSPGGRLMYCTCSLLPEEGEDQARALLSREPALFTEPAAGPEPTWITPEGWLRTRPDHWPDRGGLDGFFAAVFTRRAA